PKVVGVCPRLLGRQPQDSGLSLASSVRMATTVREVRTHVLCEHALIRALVAELVAAVLEEEDAGSTHDAIRERLGQLRARVERAIVLEEDELIPLLENADAWGAVRVERIRDQHSRMLSAVLGFESEICADHQQEEDDLVTHAEALVDAMSRDLEEEKSAL